MGRFASTGAVRHRSVHSSSSRPRAFVRACRASGHGSPQADHGPAARLVRPVARRRRATPQRRCRRLPEVVRDPAHALRWWSGAPVVLVGADCAAALAAASPPRRPRVFVLGRTPVGDALFREALGVGAETVAGLPESETWLVELLTDVGDGGAAPGVTIGVLGGSGGAGATVFAAALAQTMAEPRADPARRRRSDRGRASTASSGSRPLTASGGTRCSRRPVGSARARCARRCRGPATSRC